MAAFLVTVANIHNEAPKKIRTMIIYRISGKFDEFPLKTFLRNEV